MDPLGHLTPVEPAPQTNEPTAPPAAPPPQNVEPLPQPVPAAQPAPTQPAVAATAAQPPAAPAEPAAAPVDPLVAAGLSAMDAIENQLGAEDAPAAAPTPAAPPPVEAPPPAPVAPQQFTPVPRPEPTPELIEEFGKDSAAVIAKFISDQLGAYHQHDSVVRKNEIMGTLLNWQQSSAISAEFLGAYPEFGSHPKLGNLILTQAMQSAGPGADMQTLMSKVKVIVDTNHQYIAAMRQAQGGITHDVRPQGSRRPGMTSNAGGQRTPQAPSDQLSPTERAFSNLQQANQGPEPSSGDPFGHLRRSA